MPFRRISLQFMTGFCIFGEEMVCFEIILKNQYIFLMLGKWDCSSVGVNSTADREVDGKYNG